MQKKLLYIFTLLAAITNQIQPYFVRGSIYEKGEQLVILLGDIHLTNKDITANETQRKEFINCIQQNKDALALVEDAFCVNNYSKENLDIIKRTKEALKKRINNASISILSPLFCLHSDCESQGINSINVECRYTEAAFLFDINISTEDILNEFENNIAHVEKCITEVEKSNIENKEIILDFYKEEKKKIVDSTKEYIEILKGYANSKETYDVSEIDFSKYTVQDILLSKNPIIKERVKIGQYIGKNILKIVSFIDINIVHNIVTSKDKKIITVCSGVIHTSQVENLLCNIGYKLTNEIGISWKEANKIKDIRSADTDPNIENMNTDEINARLKKNAEIFAELQKKEAISINSLFNTVNPKEKKK